MRKYLSVLWIPVIIGAAFLLYSVKYEVQRVRGQIAETAAQLKEARESLNVAEAEWAYLNRPERLQLLAAQYLTAEDATVQQVADVQAVPFPETQVAATKPEGLQQVAYSGAAR